MINMKTSGDATSALTAIYTCSRWSVHPSVTQALRNEALTLAEQGDIRGSVVKVAIVFPACEQALALALERGSNHVSRGLARALTGDLQGAIEDFEFAVQWAEETGYSADFIESRQVWIEVLKAGKNPFDAATLAQLRRE